MNPTDKIFYILGISLLGCFAAVAILQNTGLLNLTGIKVPCSFYMASGLYCPGCGGTRAVCALAAGHIMESLRYHPFVPYTIVGIAFYVLRNTIAAVSSRIQPAHTFPDTTRRKKGLPYMHMHIAYIYIGVGILLSQWIVKDILLILSRR